MSKGEIQNFQDALDVIKQFLPFRQFSELADEFTKLETNFGKEIKSFTELLSNEIFEYTFVTF